MVLLLLLLPDFLLQLPTAAAHSSFGERKKDL